MSDTDGDPGVIQGRDGKDIKDRAGNDIQMRAVEGETPAVPELDPNEPLAFQVFASTSSTTSKPMTVRRSAVSMVIQSSSATKCELAVANLDARLVVGGTHAEVTRKVFG